MIAASQSPPVAYLWEPFSILHRPGICDARFRYWFTYVCEENASEYRGSIGDMLAFRYKTGAELGAVRTPRDGARLVRDRLRFARYRRAGARPLMKDPIAVLSAEWLCDAFDMDVVVMVRHPAAFMYSLKRLDWWHPFDHFVKQPLLMRDVLAPFEEEIRAAAAERRPIIDQAILLWNLIHHAILAYRDRRPEWTFLRLEDLALDPMARFGELYGRLGLGFDERVRATIAQHTDASNPAEVARPQDVKRDSRAAIRTWKSRLSEEEIARIRAGVEPISKELYSDADW